MATGSDRSLVTGLTTLFGLVDPLTLSDIVTRVQSVHLARAEALYRQGDPGRNMHVVLTGRLQVRVRDQEGGERVVAYLSPGDSVGEMALFTGGARTATVTAIRDTTLALLTRDTFDAVVAKHPDAAIHIARLIIGRLTTAQARGAARAPIRKNVVLVPIGGAVPIEELGRRLQLALLRSGTTAYLDSPTVRDLVSTSAGPSGAAGSGMEIGGVLDACENQHDYVIYQADPGPTEWTRKCIGYADKILLVADGHASSTPSVVETELLGDSRLGGLIESELVLVRRDTADVPIRTSDWRAPRGVDRHHHLAWAGNAGFNRLARRLSNEAVVVVLGGGGARGFAHIGAIRAIREAGIPIDAIGGTSFGAIIAALVALDYSDERVLEVCRRAFIDDRPMDDYTLPVVSLVKGQKLVATLKKYLGEVAIEDLWIPYFAVSSNLSRSRIVIHTTGPLWKAVRATVSLPGIFPPFVENGELLIDGGLLNNLPVDIMQEMITGKTIAIDVSVEEEYRIERETIPSAYEYLRAKLFAKDQATFDVPTLNRVMIKATTLGSSRLTGVVKLGADLYLNPPVRNFDLLAWDRFYDIVEVGYQYTRRKLLDWLPGRPGLVRREEIFDSRLRRSG